LDTLFTQAYGWKRYPTRELPGSKTGAELLITAPTQTVSSKYSVGFTASNKFSAQNVVFAAIACDKRLEVLSLPHVNDQKIQI